MLVTTHDLRWWVRPPLLLLALSLGGCLETSQTSASLTEVTASAAPVSLVLVGAPATDVTVNADYFFQPYVDNGGGAVSYAIDGLPEWLSFNAATGMLTGKPDATQVGTSADIVITASAANATGTIGPFRIMVHAPVMNAPSTPNVPPVISGAPAATVVAGQKYSFTPAASDAESAPLAFSIVNRPSWASFDTSTGRLSGTPALSRVGTYSNILIRVSDGFTTVGLTPFSIQVTTPSAAAVNKAPSIVGIAATSAQTGSTYSFTPSATDPNGDALTFQIQNKPAWASFNSVTGQLLGTPAASDVGTSANVVISVTDGKLSASLAAFNITVSDPAATGTAQLSWIAPTQNTDGSALTDLAGFHLLYGKDPNNLSSTITIPGASTLSYLVGNLGTGTWYFTIRAYNSAGVESAPQVAVSKTIS